MFVSSILILVALPQGGRGEVLKKKKEVAALGTVGYIPLPQKFREKGTLVEWAAKAAIELVRTRRSAVGVSSLNDPNGGDGIGSPQAPALLAYFPSEARLASALRAIEVWGHRTEVLRFTGDKDISIFIIEYGPFMNDPEIIKRAFEAQAIAKVVGWGWKCEKGTKIALLLQTEGPPSQDIRKVEVGGWQLNCLPAPEKGCCSCGGAHDPFSEGSRCKKFMNREAC